MKENIAFRRDNKNVKKPYHLKNNIFLLYVPRNIKIDTTEYGRQDSDVVDSMSKRLQRLERRKQRKFAIMNSVCGLEY